MIQTISYDSQEMLKVKNVTRIQGIDLFDAWNLSEWQYVADEFRRYVTSDVALRGEISYGWGEWWDDRAGLFDKIEEVDKDDEEGILNNISTDWLAWYVPAYPDVDGYGIHFDVGKILDLSERLKKSAEKSVEKSADNPSLKGEYLLISQILSTFWHEVCHAWVQDFVTLYELHNSETRTGEIWEHKRYYDVCRNKRRRSECKVKEEALCDSAGLLMLSSFWQNVMSGEGAEYVKVLRESRERALLNCYSGDKSLFSRNWPAFRSNMKSLLEECYGLQDAEAALHSSMYRVMRGYPLYLEGKLKPQSS